MTNTKYKIGDKYRIKVPKNGRFCFLPQDEVVIIKNIGSGGEIRVNTTKYHPCLTTKDGSWNMGIPQDSDSDKDHFLDKYGLKIDSFKERLKKWES